MTIEAYIEEKLTEAAAKAGFPLNDLPPVEITESKLKEFGDLTTNLAFVLAKRAKANPRAVAERIVSSLALDKTRIEKVQTAGNGFINFHFGPEYLAGNGS